MMKATLRLVGVDLPRARFKREPYVTSVAVCETTNGSRVPVYAHPRDPEHGEAQPVTDGVFTVTTEPTEGVNRSHPLTLDVVLYEGDPGGWLVACGAIMDSDSGFRKAGERLDSARHAVDGTPLGTALAEGAVRAIGPAAGLAIEALSEVARLLSANGDDVLCRFDVRIEAEAGFRDHPREFTVESNSCVAKFRLEVEGLPEKPVVVVTTQANQSGEMKVAPPQPEDKGDGSTGREGLDQIIEKLKPEAEAKPVAPATPAPAPPAAPRRVPAAPATPAPIPVVPAAETPKE